MNANHADTFVFGGYDFEPTVLGSAHYSVAAFLPYTWLSVSGDTAALCSIGTRSNVSGLGDVTIVPVMLAWKVEHWQYDFLMPIYAPTGTYRSGRLGNTGLSYWTVDPIVGAVCSNAQSSFNATAHLGCAINTENNETRYRSGNVLHLDTAVQQILPLGSGYATVGAEAWYFQQLTCDSGAGATLGCFKGRTAGIGPVLGYIQPIGQEKLLLEFKWLPELDTQNRLKGDYLWLKMVYTELAWRESRIRRRLACDTASRDFDASGGKCSRHAAASRKRHRRHLPLGRRGRKTCLLHQCTFRIGSTAAAPIMAKMAAATNSTA